MIPPSFIYGAEGALPVTASDSAPGDYSSAPAYEGGSFSSYISQALNPSLPKTADPYQNPALSQPDSNPSIDPPSDDYDPNSFHWSAPNTNKTSNHSDDQDDHSPKVKDRKRDDTVDPTTANNLSALAAGQNVPAPKPDQPKSLSASAKSGGANSGSESLTVLDGKGAATSVAGNDSSKQTATQTAGANGKSQTEGASELAAGLKLSEGSPVTAKDSHQTAPAPSASPPNAAGASKATTQDAILQTVAGMQAGEAPNITDAGTAAALDNEIMKSTGQQNENAGHTVQKLPRASANGGAASGSNAVSATLGTTGSGRKTEWTSPPGMAELTVQSATGELHEAPTLVTGSAADSAATQVERVAHLVTQEAMVIRQSGAANLAVSLKLDHQTELFVQLTNHNGQIQASLRCERGSLAGLDGHWGQLQESLARQNIQLLPQEGRSSFHDQAGSYSDAAGSRNPEQPSQNERQQSRILRGESTLPDRPANSTASSKSKNKNSGRKGWESWA